MATPRPLKSSLGTKSAAPALVKTMSPAAATSGSAAPDTADENIYQTCLSKLHPIMPVLAGFNHRNRSQHRHARWWAAFGVVRRGTARLISELEAARAVAKKAEKKQQRKLRDGEDGGGERGKKKEKDPVEIRAVWIRDHAAPRAYRAFSQLAADNQFAVLGLALLGVLATVRDVCVRLVGEGEVIPPVLLVAASENRNVDAAGAAAAAAAAGKAPTPAAGGRGAADLGQVVSREEVAAALASASSSSSSSSTKTKTKPDAQSNNPNASPVDMDEETEALLPPVKRKKKDPGLSSSKESSSFLTPAPKTDSGEKKRKKKPDVGPADMDDDGDKAKKKTKKKKKSKGDEFDALFSSLV